MTSVSVARGVLARQKLWLISNCFNALFLAATVGDISKQLRNSQRDMKGPRYAGGWEAVAKHFASKLLSGVHVHVATTLGQLVEHFSKTLVEACVEACGLAAREHMQQQGSEKVSVAGLLLALRLLLVD